MYHLAFSLFTEYFICMLVFDEPLSDTSKLVKSSNKIYFDSICNKKSRATD